MGPLTGIRVIEMAGIGPGPFCAMMLSDMGAEVIRIDRLNQKGSGHRANVLNRGRKSVALDLKSPQAVDACLRLIEQADVLVEGFRPGVMERLGLGPEACLQRNPGLVFGRMTGWGQDGPLSQAAGHDINYISVAGALGAMGYADRPPAPPLNLIGDFGGGAMYLLAGVLAALVERVSSAKGQVVDAAMTDGTASLLSPFYGLMSMGMWTTDRYSNRLDGGAYYYGSYECSDDRHISIGSLEPQFYALLLEKCEISDESFKDQLDQNAWPIKREKLEALFKTKTQRQWCDIMEGTDVCFAPVLSLAEAPDHPHNKARGTFVDVEGVTQPAPAPRFSRTQGEIQSTAALTGEHTEEVFKSWGFSDAEIAGLSQSGAI
ncbi:MAG TPA: CaiB/BaiF CoA-transferase family protein [Gammaproteobacteria bacterium]|jgi:alpha-methylacyl-CoA racemase|nr:CaiB/BaiF CoA-transferase family protein [Gammaproteobacteria bacterium]|tara:strand:- start:3603 stop:4730 length:1128 start_codon:yes stop_codon:yes gene_type:complete